ncbi:hypothetical protein F2Q69_00043618 [Brassica cretica]|uniref:Uncharacterized protein n=1 Tax=Brassica cretica TaxID=69181 RepID=A0A8S9N9W8_BRACR|nr:hypothetical protein F2Q69_00043618 [Brassica cretica]
MMIRAPVMMIRDPEMTTSAPAMTTSAPAMTTSASAMTIRALNIPLGLSVLLEMTITEMDLDRGPYSRIFAGLDLLRDGPKRIMRDYMDPHFFSFLILPEKNERESENKAILVTFPPENIRSSDDDDSSSGDDDSRSGDDDFSSGDDDFSFGDDDSSSGGVLI